eukprot:gene19065-25669_t
MGSDDSTGKGKIATQKTRTQWLIAFACVLIGLCIGMLVSDKDAIVKSLHSHRALSLYPTSSSSTTAAASAPVEVASPEDMFSYPFSKPPRNELEKLLREIAPSKEVLVAVANKNLLWDDMLGTFCKGLKQAGVKNHLILALDNETKKWAEEHQVNVYVMPLQNPFDHLYRDHDVEGMTDGFDERGAYGSIEGFSDPSMGWAQFAQYYKHFNMNSGLFWLKANTRVLELMTRLDDRLARQKYWDQTAYNEEIFFLSHGEYKSPQVVVRVMEIDKFMNSKRLFKIVRKMPLQQRPKLPVTVHINYHPDKHERMKAVFK